MSMIAATCANMIYQSSLIMAFSLWRCSSVCHVYGQPDQPLSITHVLIVIYQFFLIITFSLWMSSACNVDGQPDQLSYITFVLPSLNQSTHTYNLIPSVLIDGTCFILYQHPVMDFHKLDSLTVLFLDEPITEWRVHMFGFVTPCHSTE